MIPRLPVYVTMAQVSRRFNMNKPSLRDWFFDLTLLILWESSLNYLLLFPTTQDNHWTIQPIQVLLIITIMCTHSTSGVCFYSSRQRQCLFFNLTPNERFHHSANDAWYYKSNLVINVIAFFSSQFSCIRWNALKYISNKEDVNNKQ